MDDGFANVEFAGGIEWGNVEINVGQGTPGFSIDGGRLTWNGGQGWLSKFISLNLKNICIRTCQAC